MTNQEVFNIGKVLEVFNYLNPTDLDNNYIGYLIEIDRVIYQVIATEHNRLLNPDEPAHIFSDNSQALYDAMMQTPEPIQVLTSVPEEKDKDLYVDEYVIKYKGKVIANTYGPNDWDQYAQYTDEIADDENEDSKSNNSNFQQNIQNFNTPW